jgi:pilus assembly protein CpaB
MKTRRVPLIIGLILALGTGALLLGYLGSLRPSTATGGTRMVLVATHDIPARAAATADLFSLQPRLATQVDSDAISDPKDLAGTYTLVPIPAGSVATASRIGLASASTLPARLAIGMRAVSIPIDNVKGVAGLITPGDRVDVIAVPQRVGDETPRGYAILRGVLVLAMGSDVQTATASAPGPLAPAPPPLTTVTLALTPGQADLIAGADLNSALRLALRNPKEAISAYPTETLKLAPQGAIPSNGAPGATVPVASPGNPAAGQPSSRSPQGVIVIDGDRVTSGAAAPG